MRRKSIFITILSSIAISLIGVGLFFKQQGWEDFFHGEITGPLLVLGLCLYMLVNSLRISLAIVRSIKGRQVGTFANAQLRVFGSYFVLLLMFLFLVTDPFTPTPLSSFMPFYFVVLTIILLLSTGFFLRHLLKRLTILDFYNENYYIAATDKKAYLVKDLVFIFLFRSEGKILVSIKKIGNLFP